MQASCRRLCLEEPKCTFEGTFEILPEQTQISGVLVPSAFSDSVTQTSQRDALGVLWSGAPCLQSFPPGVLLLFAGSCVPRGPETREPQREGSHLAQLRNAYPLVCKGAMNVIVTVVLTQSLYLEPKLLLRYSYKYQ